MANKKGEWDVGTTIVVLFILAISLFVTAVVIDRDFRWEVINWVKSIVATDNQTAQQPLVVSNETNEINNGDSSDMVGTVIILSIIGLFLLIALLSSIYTVKQQTAAIIERFGKYVRTAGPGIHMKWPFGIDSVVAHPTLRIQQLDLEMQSKTKDDVTVTLRLAIQYVVPDISKIYDSYYKLSDPSRQIEAWVFDVVRSKVPSLLINGVYENKDEIAKDVEDSLKERMHLYGFQIVRVLVNDVVPPDKVLQAMNEVNTQQRLQAAAMAEGEKKKILVVKDAEAQAEYKALQGKGIANQRREIIKGYRDSIADFTAAIKGSSPREIMDMVIITQYFDTLEKLGGDARSKVVFLPSSPSAVGDFMNQLRTTIASAEEVGHPSGDPIAGEETKIKPIQKNADKLSKL
jgi:regulator of protease activity HflC (stomatin/prohibitin superfamily)